MKTFREVFDSVLLALKQNAVALATPVDSIEPGKLSTMPTAAPFIWVYAKPGTPITSERNASAIRKMTFTVFVGVSGDEAPSPAYNSIRAVELADRAALIIATGAGIGKLDKPMTEYDAEYDNYSVAAFDFSVSYKPTSED